MIPPPRTTSRRGTSVCARRPGRADAAWRVEARDGRSDGIRARGDDRTREAEPDVAGVERDRASVLESSGALNQVTPLALKSEATPPVICFTTAAFHLLVCAKSSGLSRDDAELRVDLARRECVRCSTQARSEYIRRAGTFPRARTPCRRTRHGHRAARPGSLPYSRPAHLEDGYVEFHGRDPRGSTRDRRAAGCGHDRVGRRAQRRLPSGGQESCVKPLSREGRALAP